MKRVVTIVGARPQFIKAAAVSRAIVEDGNICEIIVHTGQHYDDVMSKVFFDQLAIPRPRHTLELGGSSHGRMTGRMLESIESVLQEEQPDRVLVYGDTNSTLAGALAAAKLRIPVSHVEAGLRSFDRNMPEEINRILTDQIADQLFCPTKTAIANLESEGFGARAEASMYLTGDVMEDASRAFADNAVRPNGFEIDDGFVMATIHRAENTDDPQRLKEIIEGLEALSRSRPVVLPLHPRTRQALIRDGLHPSFCLIEPVGYFEILWLLGHCGLVATDSGGLQKEAFFFGRHCITLRDSTEWTELIEADVNALVGADRELIVSEGMRRLDLRVASNSSFFGGGTASKRIVSLLAEGTP